MHNSYTVVRWGIQPRFTAKSNYSKMNAARILIFSEWIVMVTRYVHVLYQISRVSHLWVRAKITAAICPTKMGAHSRRGWGIQPHPRMYAPWGRYPLVRLIAPRGCMPHGAGSRRCG